jgi:hypothetical protein
LYSFSFVSISIFFFWMSACCSYFFPLLNYPNFIIVCHKHPNLVVFLKYSNHSEFRVQQFSFGLVIRKRKTSTLYGPGQIVLCFLVGWKIVVHVEPVEEYDV